MGRLRVAAVQLGIYPKDRRRAIGEAERAAIRSARKGARLIVLPEHWLADEVLERDNDVVRRFSKLARKMNVYINLGAYYEKRPRGTFLTSVMVSPSGKDYFREDKVHLYGGEKKKATGGSGFGTCLVDGFRVGVLVCHDMVFPEAARASAAAGAELFVVPSLIIKAGAVPWLYYIRARALENRIPLVSPNIYFPPIVAGRSRIIDLDYDKKDHIMNITEKAARPGKTEVTADIDLTSKRRYRKERLSELRPDTY